MLLRRGRDGRLWGDPSRLAGWLVHLASHRFALNFFTLVEKIFRVGYHSYSPICFGRCFDSLLLSYPLAVEDHILRATVQF